MSDGMKTLKRLTDAIQWDVPVKKRTTPAEDILGGEITRIDGRYITIVGVGDAANDLRRGHRVKVVDDKGDPHSDHTPAKDIAHACVPVAPLKKWLAAFTGDAIHIHLKGGTVLIRGEIDGIEVGCLVAGRFEREESE